MVSAQFFPFLNCSLACCPYFRGDVSASACPTFNSSDRKGVSRFFIMTIAHQRIPDILDARLSKREVALEDALNATRLHVR
jgi:hypothetical protein